jgi:chromosome segregation ATPase
MVVIRFLFALLLGFVIGAGTTLWLVHSDAGDLVIRRTEVVQDLERRLREVEEQRDKLARQADDFARRFERMEGAFNELEKRFRDQTAEREQAPRAGERDGGEKPAAQP